MYKMGNYIIKIFIGKKFARIQQAQQPVNGTILEIRSCAPSVKSGVHIGSSKNRATYLKLLTSLTTMQQSHFLLQCQFGVSENYFETIMNKQKT